ncbi:hypothetical protein BELL_0938g00010 [Botrytis elliptica]|uniref:gamma-glutamylcyclotransferase n=1 Tax=Botrytis elliptica TaxID=278938 RepID=A0A4Z1J520_9HELO|nr:hypothetical protein BELL_0938g00010 [Botrytis elliptica]
MSTPSTPSPQTLYFAYGSNLSLKQMKTRCPDSTYVGTGVLQNYRWIVNQRGYANIVFCGDSGDESKSDSNSKSESGEGEGEREEEEEEEEEHSKNKKDIKNEHANATTKLPSTPQNPQNPQPTVYGLLYTLSPRDETLLDTSEGVPFAYTKISPLITLVSVSPSLGAPTISFLLSLFPGSVSVSGVSSAELAFPPLLPSSSFSAPSPPSLPPPTPPPLSLPTASQPSQLSPPLQIRALTYIDTLRITPSAPNPEYVTRMNRGIRDAISEGFPPSYVQDVLRLYIPAREEGGDF